jgi:hypothetical protein
VSQFPIKNRENKANPDEIFKNKKDGKQRRG